MKKLSADGFLIRQRAPVEIGVGLRDRIRQEGRSGDFQSESAAGEKRNYRKQSERGSEGGRASRTTGDQSRSQRPERGDSGMPFRSVPVKRKPVRRHRQVRSEKRGVQSREKHFGDGVRFSEVSRSEIVTEIVRESGNEGGGSENEGKTARRATEESGKFRGHAPILRRFLRQSSTAAVSEPSGSGGESDEDRGQRRRNRPDRDGGGFFRGVPGFAGRRLSGAGFRYGRLRSRFFRSLLRRRRRG